MKCDICDYSTAGITSLTHHKKIHYTPEKPFDCTKCGKGFKNKCQLHQHYQTPSKNKVNAFQCFICGKCFQEKLNLWQHNDNINQDTKSSLVNHVVKSLGKSARWAFILKSNTLILTCPFRNGVVRYARNHIPIQEH